MAIKSPIGLGFFKMETLRFFSLAKSWQKELKMNAIIEMFTFALSDYSFRLVSLSCLILGMSSGAIGCFATLRREALLADCIAHSSLAGVGVAFLLFGTKELIVLLTGALIMGLIAVAAIQYIVSSTKIKRDSAIAIILASIFGFGLVILTYINKLPGSAKAGLDKLIFGQAATLVRTDLDMIFITSVSVVALLVLFFRDIKISVFDPAFARTVGVNSKLISFILSLCLSVTVVVGIQTAGVILIISMIVAPAIAARQWTSHLATMLLLSALFGAIASFISSMISMYYSVPTGPVTVLILSVFAFVSLFFAPHRGILYRQIRLNRQRAQLRHVLSCGECEDKEEILKAAGLSVAVSSAHEGDEK